MRNISSDKFSCGAFSLLKETYKMDYKNKKIVNNRINLGWQLARRELLWGTQFLDEQSVRDTIVETENIVKSILKEENNEDLYISDPRRCIQNILNSYTIKGDILFSSLMLIGICSFRISLLSKMTTEKFSEWKKLAFSALVDIPSELIANKEIFFNQLMNFSPQSINDVYSFLDKYNYLDSFVDISTEHEAIKSFSKKYFEDISFENINLDDKVKESIEKRYSEIINCLRNDSPLSAIILIGGCLEALLLEEAKKNPEKYNKAKSAERKDNQALPFQKWTLSKLIDVTHELGIIDFDVKRFSHTLRDFRNFVHVHEQVNNNHYPTLESAEICLQVLKAAVVQISKK
jgi:hypothetical protein